MTNKTGSSTEIVVYPVSSLPAGGNSPGQSATQKKNSKKRRNRRKKKQNRNRSVVVSNKMQLSDLFYHHIVAPDIMGPFRQPRFGGADRTGLAMDRTRITITGGGNLVKGFQAASSFATVIGNSYSALTLSSALGAGTPISPASQFPSTTQIADINCTAISLVAYYLSSPLNASGEILFGSCLPISASATYNSMYYYPGVTAIPVAAIIQQPIRVFARKLSEVANEFVSTSAGNSDFDLPFVLTTSLPTGAELIIECCRVFEYRSTTVDGSVVTYEKQGSSTFMDTMSWQDAIGRAGALLSPVLEVVPNAIQGYANSLLGHIGPALGRQSANLIVSLMAGNSFQRASANRNQYRIEL